MQHVPDRSKIECSSCFDTLTPPLLQCPRGHGACMDCIDVDEVCQICHLRYAADPRNTAEEKEFKRSTFPCRYEDHGCPAAIEWSKLIRHESKCRFEPFSCVIKNCTWRGIDLSVHLQRNHYIPAIHATFAIDLTWSIQIDMKLETKLMECKQGRRWMVLVHFPVSTEEAKISTTPTNTTYPIRHRDPVIPRKWFLVMVEQCSLHSKSLFETNADGSGKRISSMSDFIFQIYNLNFLGDFKADLQNATPGVGSGLSTVGTGLSWTIPTPRDSKRVAVISKQVTNILPASEPNMPHVKKLKIVFAITPIVVEQRWKVTYDS